MLKQKKKKDAKKKAKAEEKKRAAPANARAPAKVDLKALRNVRVVQDNLVYVIGLSPSADAESTLCKGDHFGQYGKIVKVVVNRNHIDRTNNSASAYITFAAAPAAEAAIHSVDGFWLDGRVIRCSRGTTKYCQAFLNSRPCSNPECLFLHELGEKGSSFTKEQMVGGRSGTHFRDQTTGAPANGRAGGEDGAGADDSGGASSSSAAAAAHEDELRGPRPCLMPGTGGRPVVLSYPTPAIARAAAERNGTVFPPFLGPSAPQRAHRLDPREAAAQSSSRMQLLLHRSARQLTGAQQQMVLLLQKQQAEQLRPAGGATPLVPLQLALPPPTVPARAAASAAAVPAAASAASAAAAVLGGAALGAHDMAGAAAVLGEAPYTVGARRGAPGGFERGAGAGFGASLALGGAMGLDAPALVGGMLQPPSHTAAIPPAAPPGGPADDAQWHGMSGAVLEPESWAGGAEPTAVAPSAAAAPGTPVRPPQPRILITLNS